MNWDHLSPYEYHPERGLYHHEILPNLLCGSQPRSAADVDIIKHEIGATDIISLQQDKDLEYWGVNLDELSRQARKNGIAFRRCPVCCSHVCVGGSGASNPFLLTVQCLKLWVIPYEAPPREQLKQLLKILIAVMSSCSWS